MTQDLTTRIHSSERIVGRRATHHVYYTDRRGKRRFDPTWSDTGFDAEAEVVQAVFDLDHYRVKDVKVVAVTGGL